MEKAYKSSGCPGLVTRRLDLHGRDIQGPRESDFAKGASLKDPSRLFNASLEGNARRAIDVHEGEEIEEEAFKALIRAAVALNKASVRRK